MADCRLIDGCIFFHDKMADMPAMSEIFKDRYCRGDNTSCARHVVFQALGRGNVPRDLYPNDNDRASDLVAS